MSNEKNSAKDEVRFNVRISPGLHAALTGRARANGRSMNAEIVAILDGVVNAPDPTGLTALREEARRIDRKIFDARKDMEDLRQRRELIRSQILLARREHDAPAINSDEMVTEDMWVRRDLANGTTPGSDGK